VLRTATLVCHCLLLERDDGPVLVGLRAFQRLVAVDNDARKHNQARLRELHLNHSSEINMFCAHDPAELERAIQAAAAV
jgi:hypothetical protein